MLLVLIVVIAAPIVEELFYRGLLLRALERRVGNGWAVVWCGLIFGASHFELLQLPALAVVRHGPGRPGAAVRTARALDLRPHGLQRRDRVRVARPGDRFAPSPCHHDRRTMTPDDAQPTEPLPEGHAVSTAPAADPLRAEPGAAVDEPTAPATADPPESGRRATSATSRSGPRVRPTSTSRSSPPTRTGTTSRRRSPSPGPTATTSRPSRRATPRRGSGSCSGCCGSSTSRCRRGSRS